MADIPEQTRTEIEAAAFRRLVQHFRDRTDVQTHLSRIPEIDPEVTSGRSGHHCRSLERRFTRPVVSAHHPHE